MKYWDSEVNGLGLFVGKKSKTWYFQRDVGGQIAEQVSLWLRDLPVEKLPN